MGFFDKIKSTFSGNNNDNYDDYEGMPLTVTDEDEEEEVEPEIGFLPEDAEIPSSTIEDLLEGEKQLGFNEYLQEQGEVQEYDGLTEQQVMLAAAQVELANEQAKNEEEIEPDAYDTLMEERAEAEAARAAEFEANEEAPPLEGQMAMKGVETPTPYPERTEIVEGAAEAEAGKKRGLTSSEIGILKTLGYSDGEINMMRPMDADDIIAKGIRKVTEPESLMTDEELQRQYQESQLDWLREVAEETPPAESEVKGYESEEDEKARLLAEAGMVGKIKADVVGVPYENAKWIRKQMEAKIRRMSPEEYKEFREIQEMRRAYKKTAEAELKEQKKEVEQRAFEEKIKTEQEKAEIEYKKKYGTPEEKAEIEREEKLEEIRKKKEETQKKKEVEFAEKQIREMESEVKHLSKTQDYAKLEKEFEGEIGRAVIAAYKHPVRGKAIIQLIKALRKRAEASNVGITPELVKEARKLREQAERKYKEIAEQIARGVGKTGEAAIKKSDKPIEMFARATRRGGEGYKRQWEGSAPKILGQSPTIPAGAQTRKPLGPAGPGEPRLKESPLSTAGIQEQARFATGRSSIDTRRGIEMGPVEQGGLGTPASGARYLIGGPKQRMDVEAKDLDVFDVIGSKSRPLDTGVQRLPVGAGVGASVAPGIYVQGTPKVRKMDVRELL